MLVNRRSGIQVQISIAKILDLEVSLVIARDSLHTEGDQNKS
jgi:hypothetical protein